MVSRRCSHRPTSIRPIGFGACMTLCTTSLNWTPPCMNLLSSPSVILDSKLCRSELRQCRGGNSRIRTSLYA